MVTVNLENLFFLTWGWRWNFCLRSDSARRNKKYKRTTGMPKRIAWWTYCIFLILQCPITKRTILDMLVSSSPRMAQGILSQGIESYSFVCLYAILSCQPNWQPVNWLVDALEYVKDALGPTFSSRNGLGTSKILFFTNFGWTVHSSIFLISHKGHFV